MRSPYGIDIIEKCAECTRRSDGGFCNLSQQVIECFEHIHYPSVYPKGSVLFLEGQAPRGAYVLCSGRVKLTTCSKDGRAMILHIADPGEVLGLSAVVSGGAYEVTAETIEPCQVNFVSREDFTKFLADHGEAAIQAVRLLSENYHTAYEQIRSLGLSTSAAGKLAKLILEWTAKSGEETKQGTRIKLGLTHEEIAQMIGASRETVTRLLSDLRSKGLIHLKGSTLIVRNKRELESLLN